MNFLLDFDGFKIYLEVNGSLGGDVSFDANSKVSDTKDLVIYSTKTHFVCILHDLPC